MEQKQRIARIHELDQQIAALPVGSISTKKINGRDYYYHRWTENKKRIEKYLPFDEVDILQKQIQQRKTLEAERKKLLQHVPGQNFAVSSNHEFATTIRTGQALRSFSSPVRDFKKRECFQTLHRFIYEMKADKVLILYGLRRTGKTTLIRQLLADMSDLELAKTAFVQITPKQTLADVNRDLKYLEEQGFLYVFLDEVTLMEDFIEGAALFSDVFAACGMKIVLSGTDSLGFLFTEDEQLYDRCILLHTTHIPYREFETVLGISGVDEYIRYGGTMSLGGVHYNEASTFATKASADEYVDTSIARNIQHSLRCYQDEGHFRHLRELYEKNELTSAINRVVEDINHRFTKEVLTRDFKSHDLTLSARNLRRDRANPTDVLDRIDLPSVTERLRTLLESRNKTEMMLSPDDACAAEIREYLHLLDLIQEVDIVSLPNVNRKESRTVITQPGLRYAQASALVNSLLLDETFLDLPLPERNAVLSRILSEIKGRMMEDIILLETKLANPEKEVFILQFPIGEFDMVLFDPRLASCQIFEIKHSAEINAGQYRHLADKEKCAATEHRYGSITRKIVLYRGADTMINDIYYQNVEEYLKRLTPPSLT